MAVRRRSLSLQFGEVVKELENNLTGDGADVLLPRREKEVVKSAEEKIKKSNHLLKGGKF